MRSKKYFLLTNDCDHLNFDRHFKVLKMFYENDIKVTTALFCTLENDNSFLSKHCNSFTTEGFSNDKFKSRLNDIIKMGHEICYHGYSQISNSREKFLKGLDEFKKICGEYPSTYIEHGPNPSTHKLKKYSFKDELLNVNGKNNNSSYYIEDIIQSKFNYVWTQDYLYNKKDLKSPNIQWTKKENKINFLYRSRMANFPFYMKKNNQNVFVGYTHFGYRGYYGPKRKIILKFLRKFSENRFEYWFDDNLKKNIYEIKEFLKQKQITSLTLKEYFHEQNR